ncbi:MAG: PHB depolymerase family esterase [Bacteriovoracaceae bacterium]|nr:PHB depolymerase family esterase [Bacteriovoracaceae bacterium]
MKQDLKLGVSLLTLLSLIIGTAVLGPGEALAQIGESSLTQISSFGSNPGNLRMFTYLPKNLAKRPRALVVALHGCTQSAADYHLSAGWSHMADDFKYIVLYPQQKLRNNIKKCWNWHKDKDTRRGSGESHSLFNMIKYMIKNFNIDRNRIYITGLSGGGAMSAAMAFNYPDLFAGAVINAGVPFGCAKSFMSAVSCMKGSKSRIHYWIKRLRRGRYKQSIRFAKNKKWPKILIWQGSSDEVIDISNLSLLMKQWTTVHGVDQTVDTTEGIGQNTIKKSYYNDEGQAVVVTYETPAMRHAIQVDPSIGCGVATNQYFVNKGVCTAYESGRFFGLDR